MKVLQVINSLATGGAEKLLLESIPRFRAEGITADVLLLHGKRYPFYDELEKKKCSTINVLSSRSVYNPFLIFKIVPYLKRYDVIHVHLFPALYWVAIAKIISFSRAKLVFTEHSTSNQRRNYIIYKWTDRFIYSRYHKVVTISTEVKMFLKQHLLAKNTKFRTIHNGVNFEKFYTANPSIKENFTKDSTQKIIIQVARFTPEKDPATLIKSIAYIHQNVLLLLVGDGPQMLAMRELVSTLEIEDQILFLGIRTDVPNLLKMADVAVLSSNHEGQSLYGIEAMASGTPLVASNVSGLKTLVYGAGILFEHKDEIDLANKINRLLEDKSHYEKIKDSCLKRAQKFGLDEMVSNHIKLYNEVCKNKN